MRASYLFDGCDGDDEEEWESACHWTRGCVDDQLQGKREPYGHQSIVTLLSATGPWPPRAIFTYSKHSAGSSLS